MLTVLTIVTMIIISWVSSLPLEPDFITPIWIWLAPHGLQSATVKQWGNSASLSGYVAVCIFPISFTTTDYTAVATGVMSAADATFGKENYVNNILWDFTSESQVAFRLSHLDRPTLRYIAIGFWTVGIFNCRLRRLGFKIQWCLYGSSCWRPWLSGKRVLWFYFRLHPYWMEFYGWI